MNDALAAKADALLARVRSLETLEDTYDAWCELRLERGQAQLQLAGEQARLSEQGSFLVGAVRAAGPSSVSTEALASSGFLAGAESQLQAARERLEQEAGEEGLRFEALLTELKTLLRARVERYLLRTTPRVKLLLRSLGKERAILHLARPTGDAPVLLLHLLSGALATHYDFLTDDSTEDLALASPPLYAEEGVAPEATRPLAPALRRRLEAAPGVLPLKGMLPVFAPHRDAEGALFFRLVTRGPVLEAELEEGDGFRNILTRGEAEQLAGAFVRLKLEGRIELEVKAE